jgi:ankyrin repeat protein
MRNAARIVELLARYEADFNASRSEGMAPLHYALIAVNSLREDVARNVKALLKYGADADAVSDSGAARLVEAVIEGNSAAVGILFNHQTSHLPTTYDWNEAQ